MGREADVLEEVGGIRKFSFGIILPQLVVYKVLEWAKRKSILTNENDKKYSSGVYGEKGHTTTGEVFNEAKYKE